MASWSINGTLFTGTIITVGEDKDYPDYYLALEAAPNNSLILVDAGTFSAIPSAGNTTITGKLIYVRGIGSTTESTVLQQSVDSFYAGSGSHLYYENLTVEVIAGYQRGFNGYTGGIITVNKCREIASETNTYAVGSSGSSSPTFNFTNCFLTKGYSTFVNINLSNVNLTKVEFDTTPTSYLCSGSLSGDYVDVPTYGYGEGYGDYNITCTPAYPVGWGYAKSFPCTVSSGKPSQNAYQIDILVGESSGSVGYDVHCEGHCLSNFADVRFANAVTGDTILKYWIEDITGISPNQVARFIIKLDAVDTDSNFIMYYGNPTATSLSSGSDTFPYFDDFERGSDGDPIDIWFSAFEAISTSESYGLGTRSMKSYYPYSAPGFGWYDLDSIDDVNNEMWIQFRLNVGSVGAGDGNIFTMAKTATKAFNLSYGVAPNGYGYIDGVGYNKLGDYSASNWYLVEMKNFNWDATPDPTADYYFNGTAHTGMTANTVYGGVDRVQRFVCTYTDASLPSYIDNFRIRKFSESNAPTIGTFGEEIVITGDYNVTYDSNSGTGTAPFDSNTYHTSDTVTVLANTDLVKTGFLYDGWNTEADGSGTQYYEGNTFIITGDVTLYAIWLKKYVSNQIVKNNYLTYVAIKDHDSDSDNEPGVGVNWRSYWGQITEFPPHSNLIDIQGGDSTSNEYYHLTKDQHDNLGSSDHNLLTNLQGGGTNEYYHLTKDTYDNTNNLPLYDTILTSGVNNIDSTTIAYLMLINNKNEAVGQYSDTGEIIYVDSNGNITNLSFLNISDVESIEVLGFNDNGVMTGNYYSGGNLYGFYRESNGTIHSIPNYGLSRVNNNNVAVVSIAPDNNIYIYDIVNGITDLGALWLYTNVQGTDINDDGTIVGNCTDRDETKAFIRYSTGSYSVGHFDISGAISTILSCVNSSGDSAGKYIDSTGDEKPFIRKEDGTIILISIPSGYSNSDVFGINKYGDVIVSYYDNSTSVVGYSLMRLSDGTTTNYDSNYPMTLLYGINNTRSVVGETTDNWSTYSHPYYMIGVSNCIPDASSTTRGLITVGDGLLMTNGKLSVDVLYTGSWGE